MVIKQSGLFRNIVFTILGLVETSQTATNFLVNIFQKWFLIWKTVIKVRKIWAALWH